MRCVITDGHTDPTIRSMAIKATPAKKAYGRLKKLWWIKAKRTEVYMITANGFSSLIALIGMYLKSASSNIAGRTA